MRGHQIGIHILRIVTQVWDRCVVKPFVRMWPQKAGKRILCFGDSNTWGAKPGTGLRYRFRHRWPGVLQATLGKDFVVIEEGRKGRTTVLDDPQEWGANGKKYLVKSLRQHRCLDFVIILLGTNDLKAVFHRTAEEVAEGVEELGKLVLLNGRSSVGRAPILLLISPPVIGGDAGKVGLYEGADTKSTYLAKHYQSVAERLGCEFFDAETVIHPSVVDGVHWDQESHQIFGQVMAQHVTSLLGKAQVLVRKKY